MSPLKKSVGWLTGYRGVPMGSRLTFRRELTQAVVWVIAAATANAQLAGLVAFEALGASQWLVGAITAAMAFANLLGFAWSYLAARWGLKLTLVWAMLLAAVVMASIAVTLGPIARHGPNWVFALQVTLCYVCFSGTMVTRTSLWRVNYPHRQRAQIAARFTIWWTVLIAVWVQIVGCYLDGFIPLPQASWLAWLGRDRISLMWLYGAGDPTSYRFGCWVAVAFGLVGGLLYLRVPVRRGGRYRLVSGVPTTDRGDLVPPGRAWEAPVRPTGLFGGAWHVLRNDWRFRRYQCWQFVSGASTMIVQVPLLVLLHEKFASAIGSAAGVVVSAPFVMMLLVLPLWGRLFDRIDVCRFRTIQTSFWAAGRLVMAWGVATLSIGWVAVGAIISAGIGGGGGQLAWRMGHMQFARRHEDALYMGVHVTLTGLRGLVIPFAGIALFKLIDWHLFWLSALGQLAAIIGFATLHVQLKRADPEHERFQ